MKLDNQQERSFNFLDMQKDEIIRLYGEKKSIRAIAKILECSSSGIKRILHKYKVEGRNKCESLNLCPSEFTYEESQIILGNILGDGHICAPKKNGESQMYFGHSPKQEEYIKWKHEKLQRFVGCKIYPLVHTLDYKGEKRQYTTLNFVTRKCGLFTDLRKLFYALDENGKIDKVLDRKHLEDNLDPLSLAVWLMDDGTRNRNCLYFCTQSFTYDDNVFLLGLLKSKFNLLDGKIMKVANDKFMLRYRKEDALKLSEIVKPYVLPCMQYKLLDKN